MQIVGLLGLYFDAAVVCVMNFSLLFEKALFTWKLKTMVQGVP